MDRGRCEVFFPHYAVCAYIERKIFPFNATLRGKEGKIYLFVLRMREETENYSNLSYELNDCLPVAVYRSTLLCCSGNYVGFNANNSY